MRSINRSAILELIRENSPIARSQIARQVDVSLPTVMRIVDDLVDEDLVRVCESQGESTGGRPPSLVELNSKAYAVVGVDLGGTRMFGTVADLSGAVQHELRVAPQKDDGPTDRLERLCEMIQALLDAPRPSDQRIRGVGVGAPGVTLIPEGVVTWAPSLGWRNLPLKEILNSRFDVPVFVENDVNLAALGELGFGAGRGARDLVAISVGTGIGAGIVIGGALYRGHNQAAGEVCYMLPGIEFLGKHYDEFGALESMASAIGIVSRARELIAAEGDPVPEELDAEEVFAAARDGASWAQQVVDETVNYLSLAIVNISATLDPEVVVLGGGVARSADLLIEPILQRIDGVVPSVPQLVASPLGRRAVVMGAIMLVLNITADYFAIKRLP
jgi:glucokinase-like ROK family protein